MSIEGVPFDPSEGGEVAEPAHEGAIEQAQNVSSRLAELAAADQAEREVKRDEESWDRIAVADRQRRAEVAALWQSRPEAFVSPDDFANAALIFQHGENGHDIDQALQFAKEAVRRGQSPVRSLIPQAFDRRMTTRFREQGVPMEAWRQRYGTQSYYRDGWFVPPMDGTAEADELAYYGLNPLNEGETREQMRQAAEDRWEAMQVEERRQVAEYLLARVG